MVIGGCGFNYRRSATFGVEMRKTITYRVKDVFSSILASIMYRTETFLDHYNGPKYKSVIQDYDNALRAKIKYTDEEGSYEDARDMLWDEMQTAGLTVWD